MYELNKRSKEVEALFAMEREKETTIVKEPEDIYKATLKYAIKEQEYFLSILFRGDHSIINTIEVSKGLVNRTLVGPREVFKEAIRYNAESIAIVHNHPSGNLEPSHEDNEITQRLVNCSNILGIPILDHVIISTKGFYSYMENQPHILESRRHF